MANNPYPEYDIPKEVFQNQNMAKGLAASGLPAAQYQQGQQNIQRNQISSINAAQSRRGGIGLIGNIQQRTNDANLGLDVANANARRQNMQGLMAANSAVAGYRDKAWGWNKQNKYNETRQYALSLQGAGNQNIMGGIDSALGGAVAQWGGGSMGGGLFGGGGRRYAGGGANSPTYYNGYQPENGY